MSPLLLKCVFDKVLNIMETNEKNRELSSKRHIAMLTTDYILGQKCLRIFIEWYKWVVMPNIMVSYTRHGKPSLNHWLILNEND